MIQDDGKGLREQAIAVDTSEGVTREAGGSGLPGSSDVLPIMFLRAREAAMKYLRPILRRHGITEQQWRVIRALEDGKPWDATTVAAKAALLGPSLSRILREMEKDGLVLRVPSPNRSRHPLVQAAPAALALLRELGPELSREHARMHERLGDDDFNELLRLLRRCEVELGSM